MSSWWWRACNLVLATNVQICFFNTLASLSGDSLFSRESFNSQKKTFQFSNYRRSFRLFGHISKHLIPVERLFFRLKKNVIPKSSKLGHWLSEPLGNFRVCCFLFAILSSSGKYEKQCTSFELVKMVSTLPATCPKRKCTIWTKPWVFRGDGAVSFREGSFFLKQKTHLCWFLMRLHWPCLFLEPSMSWHAAYAQPSLAWPYSQTIPESIAHKLDPQCCASLLIGIEKSPWLKTNGSQKPSTKHPMCPAPQSEETGEPKRVPEDLVKNKKKRFSKNPT